MKESQKNVCGNPRKNCLPYNELLEESEMEFLDKFKKISFKVLLRTTVESPGSTTADWILGESKK